MGEQELRDVSQILASCHEERRLAADDRGRELLLRARSEPSFSHPEILKGMARIVAEAERDA